MKLGNQPKKKLEYETVYYEIINGISDEPFYIRNNNLIYNLSAEIGEELIVFKVLKV